MTLEVREVKNICAIIDALCVELDAVVTNIYRQIAQGVSRLVVEDLDRAQNTSVCVSVLNNINELRKYYFADVLTLREKKLISTGRVFSRTIMRKVYDRFVISTNLLRYAKQMQYLAHDIQIMHQCYDTVAALKCTRTIYVAYIKKLTLAKKHPKYDRKAWAL